MRVQGLDCPQEIEAIRSALKGRPGLAGLSFDLIHGTVTADFDSERTDPTELARIIVEGTGLATVPQGQTDDIHASWWSRNGRWITTVGSGICLASGVAVAGLARWSESGATPQLIARSFFVVSIVVAAIDLLPRTVRTVKQLRLDIDVLMTLAIAGAMALGEWDEAATVGFLYGLSELLESLSLERARRAVRSLLEVAPEEAEVIGDDGSTRVEPASRIKAGDRILVRSGDTIPIDGTVLAGRSSVDQKSITGESVPVPRQPGDEVYAGTVNGEGTLEINATGPVGDTLIARVIARVRESQSGRAPIERRISVFARYYTPAVVAGSLLVMLVPPLVAAIAGSASMNDGALWREWFSRGLVVLVTACPCALVIATPVAVVSGLASAARAGVLIKGGQFLEEFGRLRAIAFDKTGTLTKGEPDVVEVVCAVDRKGEESMLQIAAALGDRGGHVLGKAIARHARGRQLAVPVADGYTAVPGKGALGRIGESEYHLGSHRYLDEVGLCRPDFHDRLDEAEESIGTTVGVSAPSGPLGWIRLADQPRPEAASVITELRGLGIETVMLTGDNHKTADAVARELGIGDRRSGLLPADKVSAIAEIDARHGPTGMVGDGVNDAPALAAARVSIALGGISSGAAIETADVVLMADDLSRLPWLIRHSRMTLDRIRQNIGLALSTKAVVLVLALFGIAELWTAIAADVGISLIVIANALRLLRN
jgi:Cd2+/Zn2+-exporting ATPase